MIFLQMKVRPKAILIDCSELELGRNLGQRRGRPDDNLEAYKRRLQHYREHCLPMLKALVRNIVCTTWGYYPPQLWFLRFPKKSRQIDTRQFQQIKT